MNAPGKIGGPLEVDHFDGDRGNDTIEDNADVNPSTNVSLEVNIPEVANDSSIVSPSTPPGGFRFNVTVFDFNGVAIETFFFVLVDDIEWF
ncbi:hypothetical protein Tco_1546301 [Tanacetum coccineum]